MRPRKTKAKNKPTKTTKAKLAKRKAPAKAKASEPKRAVARRNASMSDIMKLATQNKHRAIEVILEAMARPATFEEVSDRLRVAKATFAKAIDEVGTDFETLRAAAAGPARREMFVLLSAARAMGEVIAGEASVDQLSGRLDRYLDITALSPATTPAKEPSSRVSSKSEWPDTFQGWVSWSEQTEVEANYDEASRHFLAWVLRQPSKVSTGTDESGVDIVEENGVRTRPLTILLGHTQMDAIPPRRARLAVATLEKIFALKDPEGRSFNFDELRFILLWSLENKVVGAARAMTVGCHLNPRGDHSAMLRLDRSGILSSVAENPSAMLPEERKTLLDGQ